MSICDFVINLVFLAVGVILALWYENLGSPRLSITTLVTTQNTYPNGLTVRILHLMVKNSPKKLLFVPKQSANACHGNITFLYNNYESTNKSIQFKWDGSPEPIKSEILNGEVIYLPDNHLIRTTRFIDIAPGEEESLAVAIRIQGNTDAYGWSYLNYQYRDWRVPEQCLSSGDYIARITVTSGDIVIKKDFLFRNPEVFENFDFIV